MKINDLKIFVTVAESGSLTRATNILDISQPALSRHISSIEKRLDSTRLLQRTGRGVVLTPAGKRFYEFAKQMLTTWDSAVADILQLGDELPSTLAVAVPVRTGRLLIPALHREFKRVLPQLQVSIDEVAAPRSREILHLGQLDIAIAYSSQQSGSQTLEHLFEETLVVIGPESMIGKDDTPISVQELSQFPLLLTGRNTALRKLIDTAFASQSLKPKVKHELETSEALLAFVLDGEGAAILAYSNISPEHLSGDIAVRKIINPQIKRHICLNVGIHTDSRLASTSSRIIRQVLSELANSLRWRPLC